MNHNQILNKLQLDTYRQQNNIGEASREGLPSVTEVMLESEHAVIRAAGAVSVAACERVSGAVENVRQLISRE